MHLPEEDEDDDDEDVSSCEQDSSGTRDSLNALHHVESPTQSVISLWIADRLQTECHLKPTPTHTYIRT